MATGGLASTAEATHPVPLGCDTVITPQVIALHGSNDFTLTTNIGPCVGHGIVVAASGTATDPLVIDLNGKDIVGRTDVSDGGVGVLVTQASTYVIVTDGTYGSTVNADPAPAPPSSEIYEFDAAVVIEKGSSNVTVNNLHIRDNGDGFSPSEYGDGLAISDSSSNTIENNYFGVAGAVGGHVDCAPPAVLPVPPNDCWAKAGANGPYSAIGLYEASGATTADNVIKGNVIHNTYRCFSTPWVSPGSCQSDGVRLEPGVSDNTVEKNRIYGGALDGIALISGATNNTIVSNIVETNGSHHRPHRKGDGIRLLAANNNNNEIKFNRVCGNASHGIRVDLNSNGNTIDDNYVGDGSTTNPINPASSLPACADNYVVTTAAYDLSDANLSCGTNTWTSNYTAGSNTRDQTCIA